MFIKVLTPAILLERAVNSGEDAIAAWIQREIDRDLETERERRGAPYTVRDWTFQVGHVYNVTINDRSRSGRRSLKNVAFTRTGGHTRTDPTLEYASHKTAMYLAYDGRHILGVEEVLPATE